MGYRSSVVCLMYGNNDIGDNTIVKEFVRQRVEAFSGDADGHVKASFDFDGWGVRFECQDWKWYSDYADIKFLKGLFDEFEEAFIGDGDTAYALEFVRIGEESDDIEERMHGAIEGRTWINRSIVVDGN